MVLLVSGGLVVRLIKAALRALAVPIVEVVCCAAQLVGILLPSRTAHGPRALLLMKPKAVLLRPPVAKDKMDFLPLARTTAVLDLSRPPSLKPFKRKEVASLLSQSETTPHIVQQRSPGLVLTAIGLDL